MPTVTFNNCHGRKGLEVDNALRETMERIRLTAERGRFQRFLQPRI
ncbi:hypothetical protein [Burkholderia stagnalis]|nr:hypothetical protein [Burkholderia stagnalis]